MAEKKPKKPKKEPKKLRFYTWTQNNSHGYFAPPAHVVSIQAPDAATAEKRALAAGLYFDGAGDCPTCGDRWHSRPSEIADTPQLYGAPVSGCGKPWLVIYDDGREERGGTDPWG